MRELKFRAWNIHTGEYNNFVELTSYKDGSLGVTAGTENYNLIGNTENFIVEQYTGLKDKNAVEIYEGDIVSHERCKKGVVTWLEKRGGFFILFDGIGTDIIKRKPFVSAFKMNALKWEVIGNIHKKPELLK